VNDNSIIILCVSREILEGALLDRNAAYMAARSSDRGLQVKAILVVGRVENEMVTALGWALAQKPAFVLMTGALGTGAEDSARACLARAVGAVPVEKREALEFVRSSCRRLHAKGLIPDATITAEHARMAMLPPGSKCFENPIGAALGVELAVDGTRVFLLPGVPAEMQAMFSRHVLPRMLAKGPRALRKQRSIDCEGDDDSELHRILATFSKQHPRVEVRTRTMGTERDPVTQITLQAEHHDAVGLDVMLADAEFDLRSRLGLETGHGG
jgi:molybdopterin-biosynthesis enzyme MoeA-like protein